MSGEPNGPDHPVGLSEHAVPRIVAATPPPEVAVVDVRVFDGQGLDAAEESRRLAWQVAVDAAGVGTFDWDVATGVLVWDERFGVLFGYDQDAGLRAGTADFPRRVHPQDVPMVNAAMAAAIEACGPYAAEFRVVLPDGRRRWVSCRGRVVADPSGRAVRMLGAAYDITDARAQRERAEELARQAQQVARRAQLLARVGVELTETLDADHAVARLVDVLVPTMGDWCIVSLVLDAPGEDLSGDGLGGEAAGAQHAGPAPATAGAPPGYRLRDVGWAHADPAAADVLERYLQTRTSALTSDNPIARALRTGQLMQVEADAAHVLRHSLAPGPAQDLITRLNPQTGLWMPLRARGRTVGLISLYRGAGRGPWSVEDVDIVRAVAARAGLALDNTRLYQQQRQVAEELQRALLTAPPQLSHLGIAVRYVPASQAAQVGGDWYDAFVQPDGAVTLVIGDVVGHDLAAAAAMGQLRAMLRALAASTEAGPAQLLATLDTTMATLGIPLTATASIVRVTQTPSDRTHGTAQLHWSNAGHPPPVVLHPDGTTTDLSRPDPDLLLGLDPALPRTEATLSLSIGDTLLLYTDGLIERRDQPLLDGLERLHHTLTTLSSATHPGAASRHGAPMSLDRLCDQLLADLLPSRPEDDVALIAVRLTDPPVHPALS